MTVLQCCASCLVEVGFPRVLIFHQLKFRVLALCAVLLPSSSLPLPVQPIVGCVLAPFALVFGLGRLESYQCVSCLLFVLVISTISLEVAVLS